MEQNMAVRTLGRAFVTAGFLSAVLVPAAAGAAYADTGSHHPVKHHPVVTHHHPSSGHHGGATSQSTSRRLMTKAGGAMIRTKPTTARTARTVDTLHRAGTAVDVLCWTTGSRIGHDHTWYQTSAPARGYIAGAWLNIKSEPVAGVPMCK
jgi:hypothetical protein